MRHRAGGERDTQNMALPETTALGRLVKDREGDALTTKKMSLWCTEELVRKHWGSHTCLAR